MLSAEHSIDNFQITVSLEILYILLLISSFSYNIYFKKTYIREMNTQGIKALGVGTVKNWRDNNSIIDSAALHFYYILHCRMLSLSEVHSNRFHYECSSDNHREIYSCILHGT